MAELAVGQTAMGNQDPEPDAGRESLVALFLRFLSFLGATHAED